MIPCIGCGRCLMFLPFIAPFLFFLRKKWIILGLVLLLVAGIVYAAPKDFVCQRCGLCCMELGNKEVWYKQDNQLTREEIETIKTERKKYPPIEGDKVCGALVFEDKLAVCLIHKIYGYEKKPKDCQDYPRSGVCLRMKREEK